MIERVAFRNFKVLHNADLPLGRFTLIVGSNGSGKTTALHAIQYAAHWASLPYDRVVTAGYDRTGPVELVLHWSSPYQGLRMRFLWLPNGWDRKTEGAKPEWQPDLTGLDARLREIRTYSFDAGGIANPVGLQPNMELANTGGNLAGVLDQLRDRAPERFEALNDELHVWLPDFDRILFDTVGSGVRIFKLRTSHGKHAISAADLSHGTLFAVAILTLAYLPTPPPLVGLEEPDRGIHPRLLRHIQDALYQLAYPEQFGDTRDPVQVIVTTHSPYFLDLYKDHPDEVVIAQKRRDGAIFERLSDRTDITAILGDTHLGDAWYSGILGGVPSEE